MAVNGLETTESKLPETVTEETPLPAEISSELESIQNAGILSAGDLDARAFDAIRGLSATEGVAVLKQLRETNLEHVSNKSAYLCGLIKTYRQINKMAAVTKTSGETKPRTLKPDEAKIKEILERTGYTLDVSTGQRRYGGPPPNWEGPQPGPGHEIYCGQLPKDYFEDSLIPLFEKIGTIWDLRLMMDPISGRNRGYCFVTFTEKGAAEEAVKKLNNFEIKPGKTLKVNVSVANVRLFVGNIPKNRTRDEILQEFQKHTEGLLDVIVYSSPDDPNKHNRGFAFLDYDSHKSASAARRTIAGSRLHVWGSEVIVEWAEPQEEPDAETMSKVKVLYIRNLRSDVTEAQLKEKFQVYGNVERVKRVKSYGFVHFATRENALQAMEELNGTPIGESVMEISLAKPSSRNRQRERWRHPGTYRGGREAGFSGRVAYGGFVPHAGGRGMRRPYRVDYGGNAYNYYAPFGFPGSYDYYGYEASPPAPGYGYYGSGAPRYDMVRGHGYSNPGRGRSTGVNQGGWPRNQYRGWNGNRGGSRGDRLGSRF
jgi:Q family heterogeneous nuclear ribonucleoprotein R